MGPGRDHLRQRVRVSGLELAQLPVFEHQRGQAVPGGELVEHVAVGGASGAGLAAARQAQFLEEDLRQLLRGADVELLAGLLVNLLFELRHFLLEPLRHGAQRGHVEADALEFHLREHRDERHFDLREEVVHLLLAQLLVEDLGEPQRDVGVRAAVVADLPRRDAVHGDLLLALADEVGDRDHPVAQVIGREFVEPVSAALGVEDVGGDHRVENDPAQFDAVAAQHDGIVLDVLADLADRLVREDRPQRVEHLLGVERRVGRERARRDVPGLFRLPGDGEADDLREHRRGARRLQVNREPLLRAQGGEKRARALPRCPPGDRRPPLRASARPGTRR